MKNKQLFLVGGGLVVLAIVVAVVVVKGKKAEPVVEAVVEEVKAKKRISAPQNLLALAERPVVSLRPFSKNGGRFVSIELESLRKTATVAEYEIVYNVVGASAVSAAGAAIKVPEAEAEGGLQAFTGELDLASLPTKTENRFGTCSAGGACVNNNVSWGILTLNFEGEAKFGVNGKWTYFETGVAESVTEDGAFTLNSEVLGGVKDYLIMEALGIPEGVPGEVVMVADLESREGGRKAVAYQINFAAAPKEGVAQVTFAQMTAGQKVAVYDGKVWAVVDDLEAVPLADKYFYVLLVGV